MDRDIIIKAENVSKIYKLYDKPIDRLKESINPFRKNYHRDFYALNDVSFEVEKGETLGIIGKNGSGKSTLLQIITGVLTPSAGNLYVNGKISALLELGAGFNPELTGIENIYLNGSLIGYSKEEMDKKLDDIISFADIGDFVHQPVKVYSSGMFARLAFAVAINVDPDILIVDEALSVGDAFFQSKCFHRFHDFKEMGKTILFVSHDMGSVKQLCSKVLWLDKGKKVSFGNKNEVCAEYVNSQIDDRNKISKKNTNYQTNYYSKEKVKGFKGQQYIVPKIKNVIPSGGTGEAEIKSFFINDDSGSTVSTLKVDEEYTFHMIAKFNKDVQNALFGFYLENNKGIQVIGVNNAIYKKVLAYAKADCFYEVIFKLKIPKIQKGEYLISPAIACGIQENHIILCWYHNLEYVSIDNPGYNLSLIELEGEFNVIEYSDVTLDFY